MMPEWLVAWWVGLTETQRTIVIVAVVVLAIGLAFGVLGSFIFAGTDYSGFGAYLQSWFN